MSLVATQCLSQDSQPVSIWAGSSSRLQLLPALIRAGDSFTISLVDLTPLERNSSTITVALSSSKLNEEVRALLLEPKYSGAGHHVQSFSAKVETVRSESASRPDLAVVNVLPGTMLDVIYFESSSAPTSSSGPDILTTLESSSHSNAGRMQASLEVTDEARVVLEPFATPGQSLRAYCELVVRRFTQPLRGLPVQ